MIIPEKRVCDFCGAENPEHQATYLPVNTSCEWTEGRSTEPRAVSGETERNQRRIRHLHE